jgi:hypothetical protein
MPIYEYECNLGHRTEGWASVQEASEDRRCTYSWPNLLGTLSVCSAPAFRIISVTGWSTGAVSTPSDFRDRRRESDYDRKLAGAFPMHYAIDKAGRGVKK